MLRFIISKRFSQSSSLFQCNPTQKNQKVIDLVLNSPQNKNSLSQQLLNQMQIAFVSLRDRRDIRAAILKSSCQNVFCAGANLKDRLAMSAQDTDVLVCQIRRVFNMAYHLPFPLICIIDGFALGGGLQLALNSDIRIATKKSKLGLVQTTRAIIPGAGGTQTLSRTIGIAKAKQLIYTGRRISGQQACKIGLINYCQQDGKVAQQKAWSLINQMLPNGPIGIRMAKAAINAGADTDLKTGLQIQRLAYYRVIHSEDRTQGMKSFVEKRDPNYKNK